MRNHDDAAGTRYAAEARERWGGTAAYQESERRAAGRSAQEWSALSEGMDAIMEGFAALKASGISPDGEPARQQTEKLQRFITEQMYTCTNEILAGLGQMYVADARFTQFIDRHGAGTAAYVAACIGNYCSA